MGKRNGNKPEESNEERQKSTNRTTRGNKSVNSNRSGRSSNKGNNRGRTKGNSDATREQSSSTKSTNSTTWYTGVPVVAANAANIDFLIPTGELTTLNSAYVNEHSVPGIMVAEVIQTVGKADSLEDPINRSAQKIWQRIRGTKSASAPYEPCDVAILLKGAADIVSYIEYLKRIYGCSSTYCIINKYYPEGILQAMGVDSQDVIRNKHTLRASINEMVNAICSFAIPAKMPFFERSRMLYKYIYREGVTFRDQLAMFIPRGFYEYYYDTTDDDYRGHLGFVDFLATEGSPFSDPQNKTVDELIAFGWRLIRNLLTDGDMYQLSADILANIPKEELLTWSYMEDMYTTEIVADPGVFLQIHNATPIEIDPDTLDIRQTTTETASGPVGTVSCRLKAMQSSVSLERLAEMDWLQSDRVLDMMHVEPTVATVLEATRMMVAPAFDEEGNNNLSYGTEIITQIRMWERTGPGNFFLKDVPVCKALYNSDMFEVLDTERMLTTFEFAPRRTYYIGSSGTTLGSAVHIGSYANSTIIDSERIRRLHNAALLSLFSLEIGSK